MGPGRLTRRRALLSGLSSVGVLALTARARAKAPVLRPTPDQQAAEDRPGAGGPGGRPTISIDLPQLQYPGTWNPRPGALRRLASELRLRTSLEPVYQPTTVRADAPALFNTPFLYVAGERELPALGRSAELQLGRFIDLGGMVVFDSADGGMDLGFERGVVELLGRITPGSTLTPIARDHVLYRSFYMLESPVGRTATHEHLLAVQEEGRLKLVLVHNDLGGALATRSDGLFAHSCVPGGAAQREWAIRLGVNLVMYATCTDYKADRAHVETLLHSRRWR